MNRRHFLSLVGATATAPMLPALPAAQPLAVNRYTYGLAALHSRFEPGLSLADLAKRFHLTGAQAQNLAQRLVADGLVTPQGSMLRGTAMFGQTRTPQMPHRANTRRTRPNLPPLTAYLHRLCRANGLCIHPRALTGDML